MSVKKNQAIVFQKSKTTFKYNIGPFKSWNKFFFTIVVSDF